MKTKTLTALAFFLALIATGINAQNYQKGYIITNEKDTIQGLINFRTDNVNAQLCEFKTDEEADKMIYRPGEIRGYRFVPDGKYYISHDVTIDEQTEAVFLEYLVHGTIDLYYYDREGDNIYYFFEKDGRMIAFSKNPNRIENKQIIEDNRYVGRVKYYFKDFPMTMGETDKMKFNQTSFIDIAQTYHAETCAPGQPCIIYENKRPDERSIRTDFSVIAGVQLASYAANGYDIEATMQSVQPVIGAKVSIFNPRWSKYLGAQIEVALSRIDVDNMREVNSFTTREMRIKNMTANLKAGLECRLPLPRVRPFVAVGLAYTAFFAEDSEYVVKSMGIVLEEQSFAYPHKELLLG